MSGSHISHLIEGGANGCLLLHGFSGSPLEMIPLAEAIAEEGWTTGIVRLAGHGTSPQDLAQATWHDWVRSAEEAYGELHRRCRHVAIIGLSMGGAVGLHLAASAHPAAVVAISTPVRIREAFAKASRVASRVLPYAPVILKLGPREPAMRRFRSPYRQIPLRSMAQVEQLLEAMRHALPRVRAPVLIVQGRRDWVIPRDSAREIAELVGRARADIIWLPRSGHVATLDRDREILFAAVRRFLHPKLGDRR